MKKLKVIQVFENYSHVYQPYIPPVIEGLKKQDNLDMAVWAYKPSPNNEVNVVPSYLQRRLIERWHRFFNRGFKNLSFLEIKALQNNVDVIHIQQSFMFPRILGLAEIDPENRPKLIVTLRGSETYINPWVNLKWEKFFSHYGSKIDAFIVMSHNQKRYLQRWGVPADRIHVIPISFGEPFEVKPKYPSEGPIKIVSVFRLCWEKNINGNLLVVKALLEKGAAISYDIYGDGPELGKLHYLINKYGLNDAVNIRGRVLNEKLKTELNNFDVILQLSHSEAFPTSILEALSIGIPAIVSNTGGMPEVIIDGVTGYVVETNNHKVAASNIIEVMSNKEKYKSFSQNAIDFAQTNFNINVEISKLSTLYSTLINN